MKNLVMAMTGITMKQAVGFGYDADAVHLLNEHLEGRLPSNIWMIYERRTHQILGLQCIGKRVIWQNMLIFSHLRFSNN